MSNNDDQKTTRSGNGASGPEDEAQWDDRTKDYGPGYIDKVAEKLNEASAGGWDENRTVEVSTLPGVPPPVLADEVPTEAEADRPPPSASLGDASTNEFEVSAPAPPEFGGQTMLDLDASAAMERIDSARREAADAAPNAGEFSETTLIDPGALESGEGDPGDAPRKPVSAKPGASDDPFELADASYLEEEADPFKASGARKTTIPEVIPSEKSGVSQLTQDDAARIAVTDEVSVSALPAAKEESSSTESAASADSEAHTRDDLQAGSSPPKRVEEESTEAEEGDESKADSFVDSADEPPLQTLNPIPVSHDTDAVPQIDAMSTPQPTEEVEHSLGTQDISILSNADSVAADLQDVPPADGTEEVDPPGAGPKGTLVLEVEASVSQEVDPAMLPPAFPNTTGDVKSISGEMPPPPPSPDLREAMNGPGEDDAWAGYDDTGGWHTLTGESQVVMSESSQRSEPKPPAPEPHSQVSSSAVFDSSQPSAAEERAQLIGIQGADTGRQHSITGDEVLIGRSSRCSIVLAEPSVSRQHARIERRDDGFWGHVSRERALEIMRDSRIGTYGAVAVILSLGLRWAALSALAPSTGVLALIASAATGRALMVPATRIAGYARPSGLGALLEDGARWGEVAFALATAAGFYLLLGFSALWAMVVASVAAWLIFRVQLRRLGGYTGDGLGAIAHVGETAALITLAGLYA